MANLNITNIPAPRVPFIDERTGLMAREWYRFFLNLFVLTGSGNNPVSLEELQLGPPNQPDLTELLIQINQNIAPQYEDQSGDFLATLDTAQLMSMMSRFENAEAAIQGAYLQPVVQTGTIANYNLDGSPTAGGVAYGTGPALAVSAAGTVGQVLTSAGAGTPTWATPTTGTVTSVSVVSANGLAGTVATATTTPAITLSTTVTGVVKGNGTALSAAVAATDYVAPSAYASANGLTMATARLLGRTTASTGAAEEISVAGGLTLSGGTLTGTSGTVTSVTGTAPVVSSGGATPAISMPAATTSVNGYLTSTDWTTFNSKQAALVSGTNIKTVNGTTLLGSGDLGTITYAYGGTGLTSYTAGDIIYASAANTVAKLAIGTSGQRLVVAAGLPSWATDTTTGTVTSVSFTGGIITVATATTTPALTVAGTSGGIPYFSSASTWASSAALAAGSLVLGGGAGVTPATTTTGTGVVTALGVNTGTAGAFVVNGGALGTPSSGTVTNLTGTASINTNGAHNGTVGATTANTGAFTTLTASGAVTLAGATASAWTTYAPIQAVLPAISGNIEFLLGSNVYYDGAFKYVGARTASSIILGSATGAAAKLITMNVTATTGSAGGAITFVEALSITKDGIVTMGAYGVGTATFSAAGVISSVSDETWKIKDGIPSDPDAMLQKLEPGYWYYNNEKKDTFGVDRQLGFYAQNVNAAIGPEAAPEPKEGKPWGYYDRSVLAVAVMSLQKALATIQELAAKVAVLEAKCLTGDKNALDQN